MNRRSIPVCSFCNKIWSDVRKLVAGPDGVQICNECVGVCNEIIADIDVRQPAIDPGPQLPDDVVVLRAMIREHVQDNQRLTAQISELQATIADAAKLQKATTRVEEARLRTLLFRAAEDALRRIKRMGPGIWKDFRQADIGRYLMPAFTSAIESLTKGLINAAKVPPTLDREIELIRVKRSEARRQLARELKSARSQLAKIKEELRVKTALLHQYYSAVLPETSYPPIPLPMVEATSTGQGLPEISGIYFIWASNLVVYVGQSTKICARVRAQSETRSGHENVHQGDWVSWLPCAISDLNWVESFYIGLCRPYRNFGGSRKEARVLSSPHPSSQLSIGAGQ